MQWSTAVMSYDSCFRPILGIYRYGTIIYDWIVFFSIYLSYQSVMVLPHDILTFDVSCIHNGSTTLNPISEKTAHVFMFLLGLP